MDGNDMVNKGQSLREQKKTVPTVIPLVDIYENQNEILLYAELPGVSRKDIKVHIDNGTLTLSGARSIERAGVSNLDEIKDVEYSRSFSVPPTIDTARIKADLVNGVLALKLPKSEAAAPKIVEINIG